MDKELIKQKIKKVGLDETLLNMLADVAKVFYEQGYDDGFQKGCFSTIDKIDKTLKSSHEEEKNDQ